MHVYTDQNYFQFVLDIMLSLFSLDTISLQNSKQMLPPNNFGWRFSANFSSEKFRTPKKSFVGLKFKAWFVDCFDSEKLSWHDEFHTLLQPNKFKILQCFKNDYLDFILISLFDVSNEIYKYQLSSK